ncbi:MAG TPA: hypothetical protein VFG25_01520 [Nitrosopumilaceae archaeon]|nr:hypothetical protein [Nitrosopumilaceae archaeon]
MVDLMKNYSFTPDNTPWGVKIYQNNAATKYVFNDSTSWIGSSSNLVVTTTNSNSGASQQGWCAGIQGCDPWNACACTGSSVIIKAATTSNSTFTNLPVIPQISGVDVSTINIDANMGWFSSSAPGSTGPKYANLLINFWYKHKTQAKALVIDFAMGYLQRSGSAWVQRTDKPVGGQYSDNHKGSAGGLTTYHYAYNLNQATNSNTMYLKQTDVKSVVNNAFSATYGGDSVNKADYNWVDVEVGAEIDTSTEGGTGTLKAAIQRCRVSW